MKNTKNYEFSTEVYKDVYRVDIDANQIAVSITEVVMLMAGVIFIVLISSRIMAYLNKDKVQHSIKKVNNKWIEDVIFCCENEKKDSTRYGSKRKKLLFSYIDSLSDLRIALMEKNRTNVILSDPEYKIAILNDIYFDVVRETLHCVSELIRIKCESFEFENRGVNSHIKSLACIFQKVSPSAFEKNEKFVQDNVYKPKKWKHTYFIKGIFKNHQHNIDRSFPSIHDQLTDLVEIALEKQMMLLHHQLEEFRTFLIHNDSGA